MPQETDRIVFAGGGPGGHLFPALAVADELAGRKLNVSISFIGGSKGLEQRLVPAAGYPLESLRLSGIKGRGPIARLGAAINAAWAVCRCVLWMLRSRPRLVIGVGGYASGPGVLAARLLKIKTMIMEQNHFPGATNRWLAPRVDAVCVPSEAARKRLGGRGTITGNPVRREFLTIGEPAEADVMRVLIFGGSRGAHSINMAILDALEPLARLDSPPRIVHQTGAADEEQVLEGYAGYPEDRFEVHAFLDDMPSRLAASDLVVCRSGASTLSELAAAGRPALLIPYPHAADDHQRHNAETLVEAGAAHMLLDGDLDGRRLASQITELAGAPQQRRSMGRAARTLAFPDAAGNIADVAECLMAEGRHVS